VQVAALKRDAKSFEGIEEGSTDVEEEHLSDDERTAGQVLTPAPVQSQHASARVYPHGPCRLS
jgi:hypothetical protein